MRVDRMVYPSQRPRGDRRIGVPFRGVKTARSSTPMPRPNLHERTNNRRKIRRSFVEADRLLVDCSSRQ